MSQNLPPTSLDIQTNLTGSVTDIDESPDSPDANWLTASGSSTCRVGFATPTTPPNSITERFRAWVRRDAAATSSGTLYPDGAGVTNYDTSTGSSAVDCVDEDQNAFVTSYWFDTADDPIATATFATPSSSPGGIQTISV